MRMAKIHAQYLNDLLRIERHPHQEMNWEAEHLSGSRYVVRPRGQLGTMGWHPRAWTAAFITAHSCADAMAKFNQLPRR